MSAYMIAEIDVTDAVAYEEYRRQVVAVVNFPPTRIAGFESQVLVLGVPDKGGDVVLLAPDHEVPPGSRLY